MRFAAILCAVALAAGFSAARAQPLNRGCAGVPPLTQSLDGAQAIAYRNASGRDLKLFVLRPAKAEGPAPAILFFFGGGWRTGDVRAFEGQARTLASHGMVAVLADYRVSCRDHTTPADAVDDAQAADAYLVDHARDLGIDPKRIVLSGGSAGGHLALTTALLAPPARRPVALVLFNPAVDLVSLAPLIHLTAESAAPISPSVLPVADMPPAIVFHGQADHTIPIATVRAFCKRATDAGRTCELHEYAGQDHGFFHKTGIDPAIGVSPYDDTLARALAFLQRLKLAS